MQDSEKASRRQQCILNAVSTALQDVDYRDLTIEDIALRASRPFIAGGKRKPIWFLMRLKQRP